MKKNKFKFSIKFEAFILSKKFLITNFLIKDTNEYKKLENIILKEIKNIHISKDEFNVLRKIVIMSFMNTNNDLHSQFENLTNNYICYDYDKEVTINDINIFNYDKILSLINKLDFSNYSIVCQSKNEIK